MAEAMEAQEGCEEWVTRSVLDFARRGFRWAITKADFDKDGGAGFDGRAVDRLWLRVFLCQLACAVPAPPTSGRFPTAAGSDHALPYKTRPLTITQATEK